MDQISLLWLLSFMNRHYKVPSYIKYHRRNHHVVTRQDKFHTILTPPHSSVSRRQGRSDDKKSTYAFNVDHEILARNHLPASDLEKGWVIESGASSHMTPSRKDCKNIQPVNRKIFLADGSTVLCKEMGAIGILITEGQTKLGILKLDNVLIVPNLDRRLFLVNSFL